MKDGRGRRLRSQLEAVETLVLVGHAIDLDDLNARLVVELWIDGWPARLARAHQFVESLFQEGLGDACYGFRFVLDDQTVKAGALAEVRLANTGELLGEPLRVGPEVNWARGQAEARWLGGLAVTGWIGPSHGGEAPVVRALVDGEPVAEARADRWTYLTDGAEAAPVRAFDLNLPPDLADGRTRRIRIVDPQGQDLPGSPIAVLAFEDGLARFCADHAEIEAERPRGAVFDAMFARAHPLRDYRAWPDRFPASRPVLARRPKAAVALIGPADPEPTLASLEAQQGCDWVAAALQGHNSTGFEAADLGEFLAEEGRDADSSFSRPPAPCSRRSRSPDTRKGSRPSHTPGSSMATSRSFPIMAKNGRWRLRHSITNACLSRAMPPSAAQRDEAIWKPRSAQAFRISIR